MCDSSVCRRASRPPLPKVERDQLVAEVADGLEQARQALRGLKWHGRSIDECIEIDNALEAVEQMLGEDRQSAAFALTTLLLGDELGDCEGCGMDGTELKDEERICVECRTGYDFERGVL